MSSYRPYKFLVIPVVQEVNDEGTVINELSPEQPVPVFGIDGLHKFADGFEADLVSRVAQNGAGAVPANVRPSAV